MKGRGVGLTEIRTHFLVIDPVKTNSARLFEKGIFGPKVEKKFLFRLIKKKFKNVFSDKMLNSVH